MTLKQRLMKLKKEEFVKATEEYFKCLGKWEFYNAQCFGICAFRFICKKISK